MKDTIINLYVLLTRTNYEIVIAKRLIDSKELETPRGYLERYATLLKLRRELKEILGIAELERQTEVIQVP